VSQDRRRAGRASGMLMRLGRQGIHRDGPVGAFRLVAATAQLIQHPLPRTVPRPPPVSHVDGLPVPVLRRQIPPRRTGTRPPQHSVDDAPMILPPAAAPRRTVRQQRLQPSPLRIRQIMTTNHKSGLSHPPSKIQETRPRSTAARINGRLRNKRMMVLPISGSTVIRRPGHPIPRAAGLPTIAARFTHPNGNRTAPDSEATRWTAVDSDRQPTVWLPLQRCGARLRDGDVRRRVVGVPGGRREGADGHLVDRSR